MAVFVKEVYKNVAGTLLAEGILLYMDQAMKLLNEMLASAERLSKDLVHFLTPHSSSPHARLPPLSQTRQDHDNYLACRDALRGLTALKAPITDGAMKAWAQINATLTTFAAKGQKDLVATLTDTALKSVPAIQALIFLLPPRRDT